MEKASLEQQKVLEESVENTRKLEVRDSRIDSCCIVVICEWQNQVNAFRQEIGAMAQRSVILQHENEEKTMQQHHLSHQIEILVSENEKQAQVALDVSLILPISCAAKRFRCACG